MREVYMISGSEMIDGWLMGGDEMIDGWLTGGDEMCRYRDVN